MDSISDASQLRIALRRYLDALRDLSQAEDEIRRAARSSDSDDGPILFILPEGVFWPPTQQIRCTAHAGWGRRCHRLVFDQGQVWRWRGPFAHLDEDWIGPLLSQTCRVHDDGRGAFAPPDWHRIPIDPAVIEHLPD